MVFVPTELISLAVFIMLLLLLLLPGRQMLLLVLSSPPPASRCHLSSCSDCEAGCSFLSLAVAPSHSLTLSAPHSFFPFYPGIASAAPPRRCSLFFLSPLIAASSLVFRCLHCPVDPLVLFFSPPLLLCCPLSFLQSPVTSQTTRPCALTAAKMVPSASPTPPSPALQTSSSPSASSSCAALHPVRLSTLFSSFLGFYQVSAASTSQKSEAEILYVSVILTWR